MAKPTCARYSRISFFIFSLSVLLGGIFIITNHQQSTDYSPTNEIVQAQTINTDWPMWMHDPQHTGSTPAEFSPTLQDNDCQRTSPQDVRPCMQIKWKKSYITEWANGLSQPVIYGSTVIAANMDGKVYAFNIETGAELWVFDSQSAIGVTPAIAENKVYFGNFAGTIFGLNLVDGAKLFTPIQTGEPIYSSPTLIRENNVLKLFIGSNDGNLYAINGDTGSILFSYDTRSTIFSNPAYYSGKVFITSGDLNALAINSQTGTLIWKKPLDGESARGSHPVIASASNTVLFYTVPRFGETGHGLKDMYEYVDLTGALASSGKTPTQILSSYQNNVIAHPGTKSVFLFDITTGNEVTSFTISGTPLSMIPLNIWYVNGQNYPLVLNNNELIFGAFGGYLRLNTSTKIINVISKNQPFRGDEYTSGILSNGWLYGGYLANIGKLKMQGIVDVDKTNWGANQQMLRGCKDCGDLGGSNPYPYQPLDTSSISRHWGGYTGDGFTNLGGYFIIGGNNHALYSAYGYLYVF